MRSRLLEFAVSVLAVSFWSYTLNTVILLLGLLLVLTILIGIGIGVMVELLLPGYTFHELLLAMLWVQRVRLQRGTW